MSTEKQDNQEIEEQTTEAIGETSNHENEIQDHTDNADTETPADDGGKVHREAAKYRTQLRETEAALETITGQRNQLAQQVIENNLGNLKPNVFWKLADEVTDYINDDGTLDLEKVKTTAERIADDLGINTGPLIPGQEKRPEKVNTGNRLQQAFEPR
jgi:DNA repair exonuclease SbcCD ATPase subunit